MLSVRQLEIIYEKIYDHNSDKLWMVEKKKMISSYKSIKQPLS